MTSVNPEQQPDGGAGTFLRNPFFAALAVAGVVFIAIEAVRLLGNGNSPSTASLPACDTATLDKASGRTGELFGERAAYANFVIHGPDAACRVKSSPVTVVAKGPDGAVLGTATSADGADLAYDPNNNRSYHLQVESSKCAADTRGPVTFTATMPWGTAYTLQGKDFRTCGTLTVTILRSGKI